MSTQKAPNDNWWRGGVIYQIYPRSFRDSNGDGVGDLPGITQQLDYVASLGVDCIWLSPFFKSPMKDFGYDVSDYCDVDPMFGTLDDCRAMVARAHELGLKVMIDQVLSHTSEQHPWFVQSRASLDNPKADWYVWADANDDGTPPNNWLSIFGGSAWQWDTRRQQYYMHNFLTSQPDLNFHCPAVQDALLQTVKFWLDLGIDGFRLDTANFYVHDQQLRSNPARGRPTGNDPAVNGVNPYGWQWHRFDKSQPENLVFMQRLRALVDQYPNTTMVGEIGDDDGLARVAEYTSGGDKLHMAYCFDLLGPEHSASFVRGVIERFERLGGQDAWPCWSLSNHDVDRVASRWDLANDAAQRMPVFAAMLLSLRGSSCIYQGEELGLPDAVLTFEELQDPYGITMWPEFKGRDGCRTPMPWRADAPNAGFGEGKPWLPVSAAHLPLAADRQETDPHSLLNSYRRLLHWRRTQPALVQGNLQMLPGSEQVLAYRRTLDDQSVTCVFNLSAQAASYDVGAGAALLDSGLVGAQLQGSTLQLQPWSGAFLRV
jgi:alpha-glucosidase